MKGIPCAICGDGKVLKVKGELGESEEATDRNNEWRRVENAASMDVC